MIYHIYVQHMSSKKNRVIGKRTPTISLHDKKLVETVQIGTHTLRIYAGTSTSSPYGYFIPSVLPSYLSHLVLHTNDLYLDCKTHDDIWTLLHNLSDVHVEGEPKRPRRIVDSLEDTRTCVPII